MLMEKIRGLVTLGTHDFSLLECLSSALNLQSCHLSRVYMFRSFTSFLHVCPKLSLLQPVFNQITQEFLTGTMLIQSTVRICCFSGAVVTRCLISILPLSPTGPNSLCKIFYGIPDEVRPPRHLSDSGGLVASMAPAKGQVIKESRSFAPNDLPTHPAPLPSSRPFLATSLHSKLQKSSFL